MSIQLILILFVSRTHILKKSSQSGNRLDASYAPLSLHSPPPLLSFSAPFFCYLKCRAGPTLLRVLATVLLTRPSVSRSWCRCVDQSAATQLKGKQRATPCTKRTYCAMGEKNMHSIQRQNNKYFIKRMLCFYEFPP